MIYAQISISGFVKLRFAYIPVDLWIVIQTGSVFGASRLKSQNNSELLNVLLIKSQNYYHYCSSLVIKAM